MWDEDHTEATMAAKSDSTDTCPICVETELRHVRCSNAACAFSVTTCPRCDREQAVRAFVVDHEKDCVHGPAVPAAVNSSAAFRLPRRDAA